MSKDDLVPGSRPGDASALSPVERLLIECLGRIEVEGTQVLDELCAREPEHAQALRARLAALTDAGLVDLGTAPGDSSFPERLGDFRLIERLGAGGMGVVYLAEQVPLARRVALKLIRPEQLYFAGVRERFQREVEASARLSHPNIAAVYTLGEEAGIPFYAMEYVHGAPLSRVLAAAGGRDPAALSGRDLAAWISALVPQGERELDLTARPFTLTWTEAMAWIAREVAQALGHAHQRGVLHRDVKPANVMLTPRGRVLLVDFGLSSLQGATRLTRTGSQVGSLQYMAPELLDREAEAVDARVDVYSLGITLYELLALRPPFEGQSSAAVLRAVIAGRIPALRRANSAVSRDLETVVATAARLEPSRRYTSVEAMTSDLGSVLDLRPIQARRAGPLERTLLWSRRNPARAVAAALALVLVVGGPVVFGLQQASAKDAIQTKNREISGKNLEIERTNVDLALAVEQARESESVARLAQQEAQAEARRAMAETRTTEQVMEFMFSSFDLQSPGNARGREVTVREALERGTLLLEEDSSVDPLVRGKFRSALGRMWNTLGDHGRSEPLLGEAIALLEPQLDASDAGLLLLRHELADDLIALARYPEARALLERVLSDLPGCADCPPERAIQTTFTLARLEFLVGNLDASEALYRQVLDSLPPEDMEQSENGLTALNGIAIALYGKRRFNEAIDYQRRSVAGQRRIQGDDHPRTIDALTNLAVMLVSANEFREAREVGREAAASAERVFGPDHEATLSAKGTLAMSSSRFGDLPAAESVQREVLASWQRVRGASHPDTWIAKVNLSANLRRQKRFEEAEELILPAFEEARVALGAAHTNVLAFQDNLAALYDDWGRYERAAELAEDLHRIADADNPSCGAWARYAWKLRALAEQDERLARSP